MNDLGTENGIHRRGYGNRNVELVELLYTEVKTYQVGGSHNNEIAKIGNQDTMVSILVSHGQYRLNS